MASDDWKASLRPASFRGEPFHTLEHEAEYGRRLADHTYLQRDLPWSEDLGRRPREFRVEGYVLGPDYPALRDALIAAAEEKGPATLVHFYLGEMNVTCRSVRVRESSDEGGMARVLFTFSEAGERQHPAAGQDTPAVAVAAAENAQEVAAAEAADSFDVSGRPQFVADDLAAGVGRFADAIEAAVTPIRAGLANAAGFALAIASLRSQAIGLVRLPGQLADAVLGVIELAGDFTLPSSVPPARRAYEVVRPFTMLADFAEPAVTGATPARLQQAVNRNTLTRLVRQAALAAAATAASRTDFDSLDQAVTIRDDVADRMDAEMAVADDAPYAALSQLRTAFVRDVTARGADRTRLATVSPAETMPALVLAWDLYGDAAFEADIVTRNNIPHPGFVAAAEPLEVLARP